MAAKKKAAVKKAAKKSGPRRRAANPTKDETVEVTGGETGSAPLLAGNMPPTKDLMYHVGQIKGYQDAAKTASGRVTAAKKAAKEAGVDLTAIALHLGFKRTDALDLATLLRQLSAMMREDGLPVQLSLYEPKFGTLEAQAKHEGWNDAKNDRSPNTTRWPEGAPGHSEYLRSWNDGTRDNTVSRVTGGKEAMEEQESED